MLKYSHCFWTLWNIVEIENIESSFIMIVSSGFLKIKIYWKNLPFFDCIVQLTQEMNLQQY